MAEKIPLEDLSWIGVRYSNTESQALSGNLGDIFAQFSQRRLRKLSTLLDAKLEIVEHGEHSIGDDQSERIRGNTANELTPGTKTNQGCQVSGFSSLQTSGRRHPTVVVPKL